MNENIEKAPMHEYYITRPIRAAAQKIAQLAIRMHRKINKSWYCDGCGIFHSGRVYEYSISPDFDSVCVKHIELKSLSAYTVYLGGKRCTGAVLPRIRKIYGIQADEQLCAMCGQPRRDMALCDLCSAPGFVCADCCDSCYKSEPFPCPSREEREGKI